MKNRKIMAILGLPGAGKSEVINYLIEKLNWPKVYFGDVTFDEIKKRGLEINEGNERKIREELRQKYGQAHYATEVIKKIKSLSVNLSVLVESLYHWVEYLEFKREFGDDFIAVAVYAPSKVRYERLSKRPVRPLTAEEAQSRDYAQIENLFQGGPIAIADYTVINNGTLDNLYSQLDKIIIDLNK